MSRRRRPGQRAPGRCAARGEMLMRLTLSVIKADVGSVGGHTKPSARMMATVEGEGGKAIDNGRRLANPDRLDAVVPKHLSHFRQSLRILGRAEAPEPIPRKAPAT